MLYFSLNRTNPVSAWLGKQLARLPYEGTILAIVFAGACLIAAKVLYKLSEKFRKATKALEFHYILFLVISVVVIIYYGGTINTVQKIMKQIQPSVTVLDSCKECGQARKISACTRVAYENKKSIDKALNAFSDYRKVLFVMHVLAAIFVSLLVVSAVVSLYKYWKVQNLKVWILS